MRARPPERMLSRLAIFSFLAASARRAADGTQRQHRLHDWPAPALSAQPGVAGRLGVGDVRLRCGCISLRERVVPAARRCQHADGPCGRVVVYAACQESCAKRCRASVASICNEQRCGKSRRDCERVSGARRRRRSLRHAGEFRSGRCSLGLCSGPISVATTRLYQRNASSQIPWLCARHRI